MYSKTVVIIPAFNEENAVGKVVSAIPKEWVDKIIVVNNASTDNTRKRAEAEGAIVIDQPIKGYGNACLKGINYIKENDLHPEIVVFIDADFSDYPEEMPLLIKPITEEGYDMVIGSRALGNRQRGSMTIPQVFGNWLATNLIKLFYKVNFTDLGPFRSIRYNKLLAINMQDKTYGWTVEMQVKAAKHQLKCTEVPVNYKTRIGTSKVSGTVKGTIMAGYKILYTIFRYL
ncbi:glycosyltransferase family 2 protein [Marivirga atlantica]|jgi:glycosyltransferase involved in cell wall biosynthesis|uniref:Glycosyltransferase family 2 protein n=1 Tax=Marivirga atlantica TaxID=1548457 RepID=A0A937AMY9_9BACT|nr:glycosyltransferase family 2 protein [Marivirga atlantica]MBL0766483.1 glycosyltransferase family 2 protein [Marivirga atlantica]